jgi:O-antigen/teichoic acid export membrane protein
VNQPQRRSGDIPTGLYKNEILQKERESGCAAAPDESFSREGETVSAGSQEAGDSMTALSYPRQILLNTVFLLSGRLVSRVMQFFMYVYAARVLGVEQFGLFAFSLATVNILAIAMDLGVSRYIVQLASRDLRTASRYQGLNLRLAGLMSPLGYALIMIVGALVSDDGRAIPLLAILGLVAVLDRFTRVFSAVFEANLEMRYPAQVIALSNTAMSIVGLLLLHFSGGLIAFCSVFPLGASLRLIFTAIYCVRTYGPPQFSADFRMLPTMKGALPFTASKVFVRIYYQIDTLFLAALSGNIVVGHYNSAYKVLEAPLFLESAFVTSLFPAVSRLFAEDRRKLRRIVTRSYHYAWALGISIALPVAFLSEDLVVVLFGDSYRPAGPLLTILILSLIVKMPTRILGSSLRGIGMQKATAIVTGFAALLNVTLNILLIPRHGASGAAWATVATEGFVSVVYYVVARKYIGALINSSFALRICSLSFLWGVSLMVTAELTLAIRILTSIILFFLFLEVTKLFRLKDIHGLLQKK